jgi:secreted trypsin-like serine protease
MKRWALLSILVAGLVGCAADAQETSESSIINGETNNGDPAVMALYAQVPGAEGGALCTTTLVSPTVLITAAHCVAAEMFEGTPKFVAISGTNIRDTATRVIRPIKEVHWNTKFDKNAPQNGNDIAVAILEEPITDIRPIPFNTAPLTEASNGQELRITGYGLADGFEQFGGGGGESSAGTKRVAKTKQIGFDDLTVELGATSLFGTFTGESNICSGDSGGPVFANINGVETIVAVNSYGMIACLGSSHSTRVDKYTSFLRDYLPIH